MPVVPPFQLLDRYDVIEEIGRGGHAVVYRAYDRALTRDVAVKVLREDVLAPTIKARFTQEIQVMATLQHPHILHVHDSGTFDGQPFVVMALAPAQTLAHRLEREPQLPIQDAVQMAREVGSALAHAHARGVLHRDVKPENILLSDGGAILADFGIARVTGELAISRITSTGEAVGTLQYMSPEQLCAEPVDARSDQYALACVLYEMIAGMHPHPAATFEALRALRLMGRQTPLSLLRPSVSPVLEEVVTRAMAVTPADRFRSMDEFLMALDLTRTGDATIVGVTGSGVAIRSDSRGHAAVAAPVRRSGRRAWVAGGVLAMGAAGAALWTSGGVRASPAVTGPTVSLAIEGDSLTRVFSERVQRELSAWDGVTMVPRDGTWRLQATATVLGDSVQLRLEGSGTPLVAADLGASDTTRLQVSRMLPRAVFATAGDRIAAMVREVLAGVAVDNVPGLEGLPGRSVPALRAYVRGHAHMRAGEFDSAAADFRVARDAAPRFAQAHFWAAQNSAWSTPRLVERWKNDADEAVRLGALHDVDSLLAVGLQHLAAMRFPDACAAYRAATAADAASFVGWYGVGTCTRYDSVVVGSPERPRFRTSHWSALAAFQRFINVAPTSEVIGALYAPIQRTTYSAGLDLRSGRSEDGRTRYFALPSVDADTLAFLPIADGRFQRSPVPATWSEALERGRRAALELATSWVIRAPNASDARLAEASALELAGQIRRVTARSADAALDQAATLVPTPVGQARIGVARVRLMLRRGALDSATQLAKQLTDGYLAQGARSAAVDALMAPLAALVGDSTGMRHLTDGAVFTELPAVAREAMQSVWRSALLGSCEETDAALRRANAAIDASIARNDRDRARLASLHPILRFAVSCVGVRTLSEFPPISALDRVHAQMARGDLASARADLRTIRRARAGATTAGLSWDYLAAESWTLVQLGDSSAAVNQLTEALDGIAGTSTAVLDQPEQAAGLRRALQLLRQLAVAGKGGATTQRWSQRVAPLLPH